MLCCVDFHCVALICVVFVCCVDLHCVVFCLHLHCVVLCRVDLHCFVVLSTATEYKSSLVE